ncbi:hypothetical protein B0H14DRAFT_1378643 [Mycena olivaceomarginata]|nr:hypothetical protein B0H14DRAFT_1378643 [Mycena olivaceomarginata]
MLRQQSGVGLIAQVVMLLGIVCHVMMGLATDPTNFVLQTVTHIAKDHRNYSVRTQKFTAAPAAKCSITRQWFTPVDVAWAFRRVPTKRTGDITTLCREREFDQSGFEK